MRDFVALHHLDVWYASLDWEETLVRFRSEVGRGRLSVTERNVAKARAKDSLQAYEKLTRVADGRRRIVSEPPLIVPMDEFMGADREPGSSPRKSPSWIGSC